MEACNTDYYIIIIIIIIITIIIIIIITTDNYNFVVMAVSVDGRLAPQDTNSFAGTIITNERVRRYMYIRDPRKRMGDTQFNVVIQK